MIEYVTPGGLGLSLGIQTPIVIQTPGGHARWEEVAGVEELRRIVTAADQLGYHHLTCSEHFAVPDAEAGRRGKAYWDPASTLAWAAALTAHIKLATNVLVLGYHHPLEVLKQYGTVDRLSGGRLVLGVGVGTLREEFSLLEAAFDDRGPRADDSLAAIRAGWGRPVVEYSGDFYQYGPLAIEPHAPRQEVKIWVGGRTRLSLRRAVELGTGWTPFWLPLAEVRMMLAAFDLPDGFEVVLAPDRPLDPSGDADGTRRTLDRLAEAGATAVHAAFVHHSVEDYLGQLEVMAELAAAGR